MVESIEGEVMTESEDPTKSVSTVIVETISSISTLAKAGISVVFEKSEEMTNTVVVSITMKMSVHNDLANCLDETSDTSDNAGKGGIPVSRTTFSRKLSREVVISMEIRSM